MFFVGVCLKVHFHMSLNSFIASSDFCPLLIYILCKQFGPRSGLTECRSRSESNSFDALIEILKELFEKVRFGKKKQQTTTRA